MCPLTFCIFHSWKERKTKKANSIPVQEKFISRPFLEFCILFIFYSILKSFLYLNKPVRTSIIKSRSKFNLFKMLLIKNLFLVFPKSRCIFHFGKIVTKMWLTTSVLSSRKTQKRSFQLFDNAVNIKYEKNDKNRLF